MSYVKEYKNDVFCMLLEEKNYALEVYNALNKTAYDDPGLVEIMTLEKGIFLSVRNDAAYVVDDEIYFNEHQSTYNPNMPLRSLIYTADTMKTLVEGKDLFGRRLVKIPTPRYVVFYNGSEKRPDIEVQRLSDAFIKPEGEPQLELICHVYNINQGHNEELKSECRVIREYMQFVCEVRRMQREIENLEEAVAKAIDSCIENHILEDFLKERKDEVRHMMVLDCSFERREEIIRREEREEGRQEGRQEGETHGKCKELANLIIKKVRKGKSLEQTADELEREAEEIKDIYHMVEAAGGECTPEEICEKILNPTQS